MKQYIYIIGIATALASCGSSDNEYDATGTFEATEVTVSAESSGRLIQFAVNEGEPVEASARVGVIDTVQLSLKARQLGASAQSIGNQRPDIAKQVAATRQQLEKARQEVKRYRQLVDEGAANRKYLDDAVSQEKVIQGQLAALQSQLDNSTRSLNSQVSATDIQRLQVLDQLEKCHISSPISGTVLEKYAEPGEFVVTGKPLFKVADIENMFLRAYITSAQLEKVKIGQKVKVIADYGSEPERAYEGKVTWISPKSEFTPKTILTDDERADLVYAVKIAVKNDGGIKIGMYGRVKL